jgi:hypothetical protein
MQALKDVLAVSTVELRVRPAATGLGLESAFHVLFLRLACSSPKPVGSEADARWLENSFDE